MHKRRYAAANDQKVISRIKQDKTKSEEKLINHIMQKPKKITTDTCKNMIFDTQHSENKNYHIKAKLQFTHTHSFGHYQTSMVQFHKCTRRTTKRENMHHVQLLR